MRNLKRLAQKTVKSVLNVLYGFYMQSEEKSTEKAYEELLAYCPIPGSSPLCKNRIAAPEFDLTVIVPVYNAEEYLEECLLSILHQKTQYSFHVIAVNDGSTDSSGKILERFSEWSNLSIVTQENKGMSAARNAAMHEIRSEYLMFMDSDDVLMDGAIEELLCTAKALRADIVQGGFVSFDSDSGKTVGITRYTNSDHIPPNGTLAGMPWGKVYRSRLFEEVCFPLGYIHQDTIITGIITHLAENIASTSEMVCRYRIHRKSITNTVRTSPKAVHTLWVNLCVLQARTELCLKTDVDFYLHLLRQVVLSQNRLRLQPRSIQYSAFVIMREMLSIQRKGLILDSMDTKYKKLEEAILNRNYMKYLVLCGMW